MRFPILWCAIVASLIPQATSLAQSATPLEAELLQADLTQLAAEAQRVGNASRGAILFHGPLLGCARCHAVGSSNIDLLGPNLAHPRIEETMEKLVESVLRPSAKIDRNYQTTQVLTVDGQILTGLIITSASSDERITLRDATRLQDTTLAKEQIEQIKSAKTSLMPAGLVSGLSNRTEFLDLLKYLIEIREGGPERARELQPTSAQLAIQLPEYEANIDHAGMIRDWDDASFERGRAIYAGLCVNCHGTLEQPGSLATALRFAEGRFKQGTDPYTMYQTLTRGAGLMMPQPWMVPQQKYDVIHYVRRAFLREHNPSQLFPIDEAYLASLPRGEQRGPAPRKITPWSQADYGPRLINTYEIGRGARNIAQKGVALQLDRNPGGVAHGRAWVVFDHDTLRVAGMWTRRGFIDWAGIHFDGRHNVHPHVVGDLVVANPTGPGWANPDTGSLEDNGRVVGRDGRRYGPLPRDWGQYRGLYQIGQDSIVEYSVGGSRVREAFQWTDLESHDLAVPSGLFCRHLQIGPRAQALRVLVATLEPDQHSHWELLDTQHAWAAAGDTGTEQSAAFDGQTYIEFPAADALEMRTQDFTIRAVLRAEGDGTLFARAPAGEKWAPNGQSLFIRDGRLTYDVGWVGTVQAQQRIDDGRRHEVALTYRAADGLAELWIDGRSAVTKRLPLTAALESAVLRIGKTSDDFPAVSVLQQTHLERLQWLPRALTSTELGASLADEQTLTWELAEVDLDPGAAVGDTQGKLVGKVVSTSQAPSNLLAGWNASHPGGRWQVQEDQLTFEIPPGEDEFVLNLWSTRFTDPRLTADVREFVALHQQPRTDWNLQPTAPLFPEVVTTELRAGANQQGFAVDNLSIPKNNPWRAQVRPTGIDFFDDGDRLAMCTWDGDVWIASGLTALHESMAQPTELVWRRVAFGLFQPLGLKILDGQIYLTCRDQLVQLVDRNQDGEMDEYRCINNDHQVTEHFHEFAMGLQVDEAGNFYYAKSARHALTALVPHHGTLLKVSPDGERTEILATGFRAANGVCLNPDGSFIVTDQEGHWNPKNRINWVRPGEFYGNMYGYHDVIDSSDAAMEQPLCWITNAFDRSPAELLWVDSPAWGPLQGQLLNLSYGYGRVYVVPYEEVEGQMQGGMCQLPIPDFPTGIIRGRFSPFDGQLYLCGMSAWATSQTIEQGGLYRVRYTGEAAALPVQLSATGQQLRVGFSEALSPSTSLDPDDFALSVWSLKRTKNYGSKHYDERALGIDSVQLSEDRRSLLLDVPELAPTWCMEIRLLVTPQGGRPVERVIHNTIHHLGQPETGGNAP